MSRTPPAALKKFLRPYDRGVQKLAVDLRALVLDELGPCYENIYDAYSAVAIGYGASERLRDGILHIAVYSQHVNLGFNDGATLADPKRILKGNGSRIRHVTLKSAEDLKRPELRTYIRRASRQARADAKKLGEPPLKPPADVVSTVKAIYPKKRRPK
jgi:hypothetical protein